MIELSPKTAAELADAVYDVQSELLLKIFLSRPEFSGATGQTQLLTAEVGGRIFRNTKDAFGLCAVGGQNYKRQIFIVFRGSTEANNSADWVSNARIGLTPSRTGMPVHIGFNSIFTSMLEDIKKFLEKHEKNVDSIHCIGHSLGGAIATLMADWLKSYKSQAVKLYTFGAPKPGLMLFSANLTRKLGKNNIYRAYHATDPVPMIPIFPYVHAPLPGYGHYIFSSENIISAVAHGRKLYVDSVSDLTWNSLERRSPPYGTDALVESWLKSTIPVSESSPKIWQWLNAALIYVLKKIIGPAMPGLQVGAIGVFTLADTIAYILRKGIDLSKSTGQWVIWLMQKIMQVLSMKVAETKEALTRTVMRQALIRIMNKTTEDARKAVMKI